MIRRTISIVSLSLNPEGASRSALSRTSDTSAKLRAPLVAAPLKITSSMPDPRIAVGRFSPITQRSASSKLDLPQPFGPTTPVSPSWITRSVGSTKLLKPLSLSLLKRKPRPHESLFCYGRTCSEFEQARSMRVAAISRISRGYPHKRRAPGPKRQGDAPKHSSPAHFATGSRPRKIAAWEEAPQPRKQDPWSRPPSLQSSQSSPAS